ncbi:MAG: SAM-dependent methyltransferase [Oceanospirillaceae bacterium]|nr:SAM-dependent methyltransferase [Oceanospirillaceae bacterium]MBT14252.1 SAM-dependent methyltransferase [Oceanospirillaceae bacterium]|tara:strand:- start:5401 stop:5988 length:588 start_codon:yes stop_codon:yes gene_type:complete
MWDERYSTSTYVYGTEPNRFLAENTQRLPKGKVLCLAEGEGRNAVHLARCGYQVTAVDASEVGRTKALKLAQKHNVSIDYQIADLASFDLGIDQWDGIVSVFCHLPPALRCSVHQRVTRALKPGGVLLLEAYTPNQIRLGTGGPKDESMMMTVALLEKELKPLHFRHLLELQRNVVEGTGHTGTGAVVQAIAVKE